MRRLWNTLSALSLLLALGIAVLWVRSYVVADCAELRRQDCYGVLSARGSLRLWWHWQLFNANRARSEFGPPVWVVQPFSPDWALLTSSYDLSVEPARNVFHFALETDVNLSNTWNSKLHRLEFPHWALFLPVALLSAAITAIQRRGAKRHAHGRCAHCGYDLRATPGRCPECGAVPSDTPHNPPMPRTSRGML